MKIRELIEVLKAYDPELPVSDLDLAKSMAEMGDAPNDAQLRLPGL